MNLGPAADVPVGEGRAYTVDGQQIAVFRLRDGGVRAVSAICPHAGGPLADGLIDTKIVICPLHQHVYDLATGCSSTGQPSLQVYAVHVDDEGNLNVTA